jgi:hypothetical protein
MKKFRRDEMSVEKERHPLCTGTRCFVETARNVRFPP